MAEDKMITPYYSEPGIDLYLGDCLQIMKDLPDKSIDLGLTDPPYGVGKAEWDDIFPKKDYWDEIQRIIKNNANLLIFTGEKNLPQKLNILSEVFKYEWTIGWYKPNAMQFGKTGYTVQSLIFWFSKNGNNIHPKIRDVIICPIIPSENNFGHPSPKPLRVMNKLVNSFSYQSDTILDPFLGSGTTAVACKELNRRCIGIEISKEYLDISIQRIKNTTKFML